MISSLLLPNVPAVWHSAALNCVNKLGLGSRVKLHNQEDSFSFICKLPFILSVCVSFYLRAFLNSLGARTVEEKEVLAGYSILLFSIP